MYEVRQATLGDWPLISAFIDRSYGSGAPLKQRARWRWQFVDTPYALEPEGKAPVWIALHDGAVVGQLALQPALLHLAGEALPVGWIVDVMVDPAHRGKGLSHMINEAIVADGRTLVTLTMAAATRSIMERAGCVTLPPVRQMIRAERLSGATMTAQLERIAENRPGWRKPIGAFVASRIGPAVLAGGLSAAALLNRTVQGGGRPAALLRDMDLPDPALVDRLWSIQRANAGAAFDRSAAFYGWRFAAAPDLRYRYAALDERAVVVWRLPEPIELPIGTIVDVLVDPDDAAALDAGIAHAIARMSGHCEAIIAGASDPRFVAAYARRGFVTVKTHQPTVVSADPQLLAKIRGYRGSWHFSKADHDWDQVHPAGH